MTFKRVGRGLGIVREIETLEPDRSLTLRSDGHVFPAPGKAVWIETLGGGYGPPAKRSDDAILNELDDGTLADDEALRVLGEETLAALTFERDDGIS